MKAKRIEKIPISQIRILNPRTRNAVTFRGIINNIVSFRQACVTPANLAC